MAVITKAGVFTRIPTVKTAATLLILVVVASSPLLAQESGFVQAVERWNQVYEGTDLVGIRSLMLDEVTLYEPGVRDVGVEQLFGHLERILPLLEGMRLEYSDVSYYEGPELGLVTRYYKLSARLDGEEFVRFGNETLVWKKTAGEWKLLNWHISRLRM